MKPKKNLDGRNLSLDEWLALISDPPLDSVFISYAFPNDEIKNEYLISIGSRTDEEVKNLLSKFLIPSGSLGCDESIYLELKKLQKSSPEVFQIRLKNQYFKRLLIFELSNGKSVPPWEGNTWILELLPESPNKALATLEAYTSAHIQLLPDGRFQGLCDVEEIIRAKYLGFPKNHEMVVQSLFNISSRQFEQLVEKLYSAMGYETRLTAAQKDGGRDVIGYRADIGKRETIIVECKQYTHPVGVVSVRSLLGVVADEKVTKGVLVTTNSFTRDARFFANKNPQLELINGTDLVSLMNEYFGETWHLRINYLLMCDNRLKK